MTASPLELLRTHVDGVVAETEQAATCVGCLASGAQDWCRLGLSRCLVLDRPTRAERRRTGASDRS